MSYDMCRGVLFWYSYHYASGMLPAQKLVITGEAASTSRHVVDEHSENVAAVLIVRCETEDSVRLADADPSTSVMRLLEIGQLHALPWLLEAQFPGRIHPTIEAP
ncbi:hypothetical protein LTR91_026530 [Friedmanniomyces endolithicus]|uniref:Uncharacterized protein n=1 Tax=Friedmanniomyces endolithicus TaxID=329885 RepID=A0AAN6GXW0_9PEZI|nr:hypothetical protein LTR94_008144 [Friedmanniomyces endolithicus]KAK0792451.1 hypothetical protein LTR38_009861 [Friedmanniomyces endolithicus]KAK0795789.1 hypothetical protein LTR59_007336 [Friedmanniomyces endolithicus]KAK0807541.1 hypothetical protein LTR75_006618 [Friedmanniomyces endolithicus]KAK0836700.1 hypothetical protein LTR03_013439 [Friedmanniomyces endolithicus]